MKYYLKPDGSIKTAFTVLDSSGSTVYTVKTDISALRRRFLLTDTNGDVAAKIVCIRISSASQYTVSANKKHALITVDFQSQNQPVKIKGVRWQFRGDVITRTFDIIDDTGKIIMSHGRCWNINSACYAMEINEAVFKDIELCVGIAIAVDCTDLGSVAAPVPIG